MPSNTDKGHTEKTGSGKTGGQKATYGSTRSGEVAEAAAEARGGNADDETEREA
jgi:hypothetical protein